MPLDAILAAARLKALPVLSATVFIAALFPLNNIAAKYVFVCAFNASAVIVLASLVSSALNKGFWAAALAEARRFGGGAWAWVKRLYDDAIEGVVGRTLLFLIGAFLATSTFFIVRTIEIPEALRALVNLIKAMPGFLRDVNMFADLIRVWFKSIRIAWAFEVAKSFMQEMRRASDERNVGLLLVMTLLGLLVLATPLLLVRFVARTLPAPFGSTPSAPSGHGADKSDADDDSGHKRRSARRSASKNE